MAMIRAFLTGLVLVVPAFVVASSTSFAQAPVASTASTELARVMLAQQNRVRSEHGAPPLLWDEELAAKAQTYANIMAQSDVFAHDPTNRNPRQGENLWRGTRGGFPYAAMVGGWIGEQAYFKPGVFPDNSNNGNWMSVSHYTQMIWPTTTSIGCATASSATKDYLVCRYWPAGNKDGGALR